MWHLSELMRYFRSLPFGRYVKNSKTLFLFDKYGSYWKNVVNRMIFFILQCYLKIWPKLAHSLLDQRAHIYSWVGCSVVYCICTIGAADFEFSFKHSVSKFSFHHNDSGNHYGAKDYDSVIWVYRMKFLV